MSNRKKPVKKTATKGKTGVKRGRVGFPPIYDENNQEDVELVGELVDQYFEWIKGEKEKKKEKKVIKDEAGVERVVEVDYWDWVRHPEPPSVTGLTLALGFESKDTLYNYRDKPAFSYFIKRGLTRIEQYHELKIAHGDKCTGNIFGLKNMGWKDKTEVENIGATQQAVVILPSNNRDKKD